MDQEISIFKIWVLFKLICKFTYPSQNSSRHFCRDWYTNCKICVEMQKNLFKNFMESVQLAGEIWVIAHFWKWLYCYTATLTHLCIVYSHFCTEMALSSSCDRRKFIPQSLKCLLCGPLHKKFVDPCPRISKAVLKRRKNWRNYLIPSLTVKL